MVNKEIKAFVDERGRLTAFPAKRKKKIIALSYLADRIPENETYSETDFNFLLNTLHTFGDPASLRRELYDYHLINRDSAGTSYAVDPNRPSLEELLEKYAG